VSVTIERVGQIEEKGDNKKGWTIEAGTNRSEHNSEEKGETGSSLSSWYSWQ